jgi:hypothetical protein
MLLLVALIHAIHEFKNQLIPFYAPLRKGGSRGNVYNLKLLKIGLAVYPASFSEISWKNLTNFFIYVLIHAISRKRVD